MVDSKQQWKAWVYLLPALILLAVFTVYPIINTVKISLLEGYQPLGSIGGEQYAIGFANFTKVIQYKDFLTCLKNTVLLCVLTVPLSCFLALIVAVCLNSIGRLGKVLQTIYFLPYVTNTIAIGMVFSMMFNIVGLTSVEVATYSGTLEIYNIYVDSQGVERGYVAQSWGIINNLIQAFGGDPINWINAFKNINKEGASTYGANLAVMVIYIVWNALPFKI